jgi:hypothetical protein
MTATLADYIYVDTAVGGVSHRNHVRRVGELAPNGVAGVYASYQRATAELPEWVRTHRNKEGNPTVAGFTGATWTPYLPLDYDDEADPGRALEALRQAVQRFDAWGVPRDAVEYFFSGRKGFSVQMPEALFVGFTPFSDLHRQLGRAAKLIMRDVPFDRSIYDKLRLWRLPNSQHERTGLFKVQLTHDEVLSLSIDQIRRLAGQPRDTSNFPELNISADEWLPVDELVDLWQEAQKEPAEATHKAAAPITDEARDRQTVAAIAASWPYGESKVAGLSRHTDYLMPILGFLVRRTAAEHAAGLAKDGARQAGDASFLAGRDWGSEIDRLAASSAAKEQVYGLPTLAEQFPVLAAVLAVLWPAPTLDWSDTEVDAVAPFPLEVLPPICRDLVSAGAASLVVREDFIAVPLLIAAGALIGNALEIEIKPGWTEGANLSGGCVGDPGSKKSPATKLATTPLRRIQQRLAREYEEALADYEMDLATWEGTKKSERGPKPQAPKYGHVFTTDATVEALAPIMRDSKGVVLIRDELVGWVKSMDAYRNGRGADKQHYLSWWSRMPDKVDRKTSPPIWLPRPFVSVFGTIQPDILPDLADAAQREDGFIDRLLLSFPEPLPDAFSDATVPPEVLTAVDALFLRLQTLPADEDADGDARPYVVRPDDAARALWKDWYASYVAERDSDTFPTRLRGWWAKAPAQLLRLALILHALREPHPAKVAVAAPTLAAAMDLLAYFASHARRVYQHLGHQHRGMALKVLQALKEHGERSQSELLHQVFHGHGGERLRRTLEDLLEAGLVQRAMKLGTGGRSATLWRLA